jgi:hypothetical protein
MVHVRPVAAVLVKTTAVADVGVGDGAGVVGAGTVGAGDGAGVITTGAGVGARVGSSDIVMVKHPDRWHLLSLVLAIAKVWTSHHFRLLLYSTAVHPPFAMQRSWHSAREAAFARVKVPLAGFRPILVRQHPRPNNSKVAAVWV